MEEFIIVTLKPYDGAEPDIVLNKKHIRSIKDFEYEEGSIITTITGETYNVQMSAQEIFDKYLI